MAYAPSPAPGDVKELKSFLDAEFASISSESIEPKVDTLLLKVLNAEPTKMFDGLVVMVDGVNWNPGGLGKGVYAFYNGAWNRLG